jgi:hypothetical protein
MTRWVFVLLLLLSHAVFADVMNLNEFVPTHLEDATPVDEHKTIYQLSGRFDQANPDVLTWRPDIRYGATKTLQLEASTDTLSGGNESGSGETKFSAQYTVIKSNNAVPVVAITPFVNFPTGKNSQGLDNGAKLILTSTLKGTMERPETQLHLNYQLLHNSSRKSGERSDEALWAFGLARKIRENMSLVADFFHQDEPNKSHSRDHLEAGIHHQVSKEFYLSYGLGKGIGPTSPQWIGIFSLEMEI